VDRYPDGVPSLPGDLRCGRLVLPRPGRASHGCEPATTAEYSPFRTSHPTFTQTQTLTPSPTFTPIEIFTPDPIETPTARSNSSLDQPQGRIIYICQIFSDGNRNQICVINADGTGQKRISTDDNEDYLYAGLAPDGQKVLYAGRTGQVYQIFEMNVDGSDVKQLTDNTYGSYDADASPDGRSIVYVKNVNASDQSNAIWIMDRDGNNQHQVFGPPDGIGWDPSWSPNGQQILFMRDITTSYQLFVIEKEGSNPQQITNIKLLRGRSDWSPDDHTIVTYAGDAWRREIYLMNRDGTNLRQISHGGNSQGPSFSPDGHWIAFTAYFDKMGNNNGMARILG
jgi:TolB protein